MNSPLDDVLCRKKEPVVCLSCGKQVSVVGQSLPVCDDCTSIEQEKLAQEKEESEAPIKAVLDSARNWMRRNQAPPPPTVFSRLLYWISFCVFDMRRCNHCKASFWYPTSLGPYDSWCPECNFFARADSEKAKPPSPPCPPLDKKTDSQLAARTVGAIGDHHQA